MGVSKQTAPDHEYRTSVRFHGGRSPRWAGIARMVAGAMLLMVVAMGLMTLAGYSPDTAMAQSGGTSNPLTLYDANGNGRIDATEVMTAMSDFFAGRIDRDLAVRVLNLYLASANSGIAGASSTQPPPTVPSIANPCGRYDANLNGKIELSESIKAVQDYFNSLIHITDAVKVTQCYFSPTEFHQDSYSFSVGENISGKSSFVTVSASNTASYSIVDGDTSGRFAIASTTGAISVANDLDFELSAGYELIVKARSSVGAGMYDLATVYVTVTNVNEAPQFDLDTYQFALHPPATSSGDALVGAVRAQDPDADDIVRYSIRSGNVVSSGSNTFRIDGVGRIWAKRSALPSTERAYALTIRASDGNGNTDTTSVKMKLTSKPIVTLRLDRDRLAEGDSIIASVSISKAPTSNTTVTLDFGRPTSIVGAAPAAAITTPTATVQYGSFPRSIVFASGQSGTKRLTIETSGSDGTGLSGVQAGLTTSSSSVVIDNGVIPLVVHDTNIAIGESSKGEWGAIRYKKPATKPNERRYSLTVPSNKDNSLVQIDLTSGDRDADLMLLDSDGDLVEANDDSGAGSNARIVRRLASGTYTIVAHTQWPGGGGEYELSVSESTEDLTDPDGETAASASEIRRPSSISLDHLDVTGIAWKNSDCTTSITSDDVASATQGDVVCIEVTGRDFDKDDAAMALLYARSDNEAWSLPIAGVGLKYVNPTTLRGKWMAQWLSKQAGSTTGPTEYHLVIQHEEQFIAEDTLRVTPPSSESSLSYSDAKGKLSTLGFNADSLLDTFWTIYGEEGGYSDVSGFAVDFVQGATLGEWGVNSNPNRGLAYFAGWMVLGFLPGVDIVADARDFFYLEVLNCSGLWGCATAFTWDAVDLFSVIPVVGKAGDVVQAGKTGVKASKSTKVSDAGVDLVESVPDVLKSFLEGERRYNTLWSDDAITQFKRGRILESGLFRHLLETNSNLRHLDPIPGLGNFPVIDFLDPQTGMAISVKSIYTSAERYKSITSFRKTLNRYADDLIAFELDQLPASRKRTLARELPEAPDAIGSRRLDVVIPDGVSPPDDAHGRELIDFVCAQSKRMLDVFVYSTKTAGDDPFGRWPVSCGSS